MVSAFYPRGDSRFSCLHTRHKSARVAVSEIRWLSVRRSGYMLPLSATKLFDTVPEHRVSPNNFNIGSLGISSHSRDRYFRKIALILSQSSGILCQNATRNFTTRGDYYRGLTSIGLGTLGSADRSDLSLNSV